jgi:FkbM family methyltransferase
VTPQHWLRRISRRLTRFAEALEARPSQMDPGRYRDCLLTIRKLRQLHAPVRVCDVGAHKGHWSLMLARLCPSVRHVALLEPQPQLQAELARLAFPERVEVAIVPVAADRAAGTATLHGSTASASLLAPAAAQTRLFPGSIDAASVEVRTEPLDAMYARTGLPWPVLVKIDVQGNELAVLEGAPETLSRATALVVELSFRRLYDGQPPCWELMKFLEEHGYTLVASGYAWTAGAELVQVDGIFKRSSAVAGA